MGGMLGGIVFAFKMKNFVNKNLFIHQNKYFEGGSAYLNVDFALRGEPANISYP